MLLLLASDYVEPTFIAADTLPYDALSALVLPVKSQMGLQVPETP